MASVSSSGGQTATLAYDPRSGQIALPPSPPLTAWSPLDAPRRSSQSYPLDVKGGGQPIPRYLLQRTLSGRGGRRFLPKPLLSLLTLIALVGTLWGVHSLVTGTTSPTVR